MSKIFDFIKVIIKNRNIQIFWTGLGIGFGIGIFVQNLYIDNYQKAQRRDELIKTLEDNNQRLINQLRQPQVIVNHPQQTPAQKTTVQTKLNDMDIRVLSEITENAEYISTIQQKTNLKSETLAKILKKLAVYEFIYLLNSPESPNSMAHLTTTGQRYLLENNIK